MPVQPVFKKYMNLILAALVLMPMGNMSFANDAMVQRLIFEAVAQFDVVDDYTCHLDKSVMKNGRLYEDQDITVKYKKPKHYYFRWNKGISKGREVIFVEGRYRDKLVAHAGGLLNFFTLHLDPQGTLAMQKNRHSLRNSGMEKIITMIQSNYDMAHETGSGMIRFSGAGHVDGKKVWIVEGHFPENRGFYARKISVCFCPVIKLPLKISVFDESDRLVEAYVFRHLKINVGLTEDDFSPANPEYGFRRGLKQ